MSREDQMFSSYQSASANTLNPFRSEAASQNWAADLGDVALGCECADPALQIDCWGQEVAQTMQAGGPAD
jgi:hypothetical protein